MAARAGELGADEGAVLGSLEAFPLGLVLGLTDGEALAEADGDELGWGVADG